MRREIATAISASTNVLPLLVNDARPITPAAIDNIPDLAGLATMQAHPLRDIDWEADFERVLAWLESRDFSLVAKTDREDQPNSTAVNWQGNPYSGLSAFSPEDHPVYFGRERETEELLQRIVSQRAVAVVGPSGSGKSSLVAAGLLPLLGDDGENWIWVRSTPAAMGGNAIRALAQELALKLPDSPSANEIAATLEANPSAINDLGKQILSDRPDDKQVLLFIDQFEELFTARVAERHRIPLINLVDAARKSDHVRVVLTLRADYIEQFTESAILRDVLNDHGIFVGSPGITTLQEMIRSSYCGISECSC